MLWDLIVNTPVDHLFPSSNNCVASGSCGVLCATDTWKSSPILSTNDTSILRKLDVRLPVRAHVARIGVGPVRIPVAEVRAIAELALVPEVVEVAGLGRCQKCRAEYKPTLFREGERRSGLVRA